MITTEDSEGAVLEASILMASVIDLPQIQQGVPQEQQDHIQMAIRSCVTQTAVVPLDPPIDLNFPVVEEGRDDSNVPIQGCCVKGTVMTICGVHID